MSSPLLDQPQPEDKDEDWRASFFQNAMSTLVPKKKKVEEPNTDVAMSAAAVDTPTTTTSSRKNLQQEFKNLVVNKKAQKRRKAADKYEYGLPTDYPIKYPKLASDLDEFFTFMTQPSTHSQEDPIRPATAEVYIRHAKQFLGWYVHFNTDTNQTALNGDKDLSVFQLFETMEKESAKHVIDFILWLRSRDVSVSYEANILRGLIKLLKFRFARESQTDSSYGGNTFDDVPIIKEVRKLHSL